MLRTTSTRWKILSLKFLQKEARASFRPSETVHKHRGTFETRHSFQKGTRCTRCNKKWQEGYQQARSVHQDLPFLHMLFPLTTTPQLSQPVHGERKAFHVVTALSASLHHQTSFPGTTCPGPRGSWMPPLPGPSPSMLCVNTHYPSDPSRAKRPPRSASFTNFGGSQHRPLQNASSTQHSGQDLLPRIFSTFQRFIQCLTRIFEMLFPKC